MPLLPFIASSHHPRLLWASRWSPLVLSLLLLGACASGEDPVTPARPPRTLAARLHAVASCQPWHAPPETRCEYVRAHCGSLAGNLLDFLELHFCTLQDLPWASILIQLLYVSVMFMVMLETCDRFFCPSVERISEFLRLSPAVAGATLLAFGNGANDLFTQIAMAMSGANRSEGFELALTEPLGAGMFVTHVVVALIILVAPLRRVHACRATFMKDCLFFLGGVAGLLALLLRGRMERWQVVLPALYYVLYIVVTVYMGRDAEPIHADPRRHEVPHFRTTSYLDDIFVSRAVSELQDEMEVERDRERQRRVARKASVDGGGAKGGQGKGKDGGVVVATWVAEAEQGQAGEGLQALSVVRVDGGNDGGGTAEAASAVGQQQCLSTMPGDPSRQAGSHALDVSSDHTAGQGALSLPHSGGRPPPVRLVASTYPSATAPSCACTRLSETLLDPGTATLPCPCPRSCSCCSTRPASPPPPSPFAPLVRFDFASAVALATSSLEHPPDLELLKPHRCVPPCTASQQQYSPRGQYDSARCSSSTGETQHGRDSGTTGGAQYLSASPCGVHSHHPLEQPLLDSHAGQRHPPHHCLRIDWWRLSRVPVKTVLSLTMPRVSNRQGSGALYPKPYAVLLPFVLPLLLATYCFSFDPFTADWTGSSHGSRSLQLGAAACVAVSLLLLVVYPSSGKLQGVLLGVCTVVSFLGSMLWMRFAAEEVVAVTMAAGAIFEISSPLLAATFLSWAGAAGDAINNLALARDGFPTMALTACFSSPLFVLLGGLTCTLVYFAGEEGGGGGGSGGGAIVLPAEDELLWLYGSCVVCSTVWVVAMPLVFRYKLTSTTAAMALFMYLGFQLVYVYKALW